MISHREGARGFTLVELLVATAVSTIVVAAAVVLLVVQEKAFRAGSDDRALQEAGRLALEEITGSLRIAGYGVDPSLAFDFGAMASATMDRAPPGAVVPVTGYSCVNPVLCRDGAAAPDEVVFYARDPAFGHASAALPTTGQLTLTGPLNAPIRRGQVLLAMCYGGALDWAYVTVGSDVPASASATVAVSLAPGNGTAFPNQNDWLTRTCFQTRPVRFFKIDRYRYYVDSFTPAGGQVAWPGGGADWGVAGARPFLMLDQGLWDENGQPIRTVVAPDVEDLQVTYLFPNAAVPALTAVPPTPGTALVSGPGGIDLAPAAGTPAYQTLATNPAAQSNHPANIRAVRVAVVVRPPERVPNDGTPLDNQLPAAGNRPAVQSTVPGYRHMLFETTTAVHNLEARTPYIPGYSVNNGDDGLNVGGG